MSRLWQFLHLFFAFSFVGSLVVAEWNSRMARASQDWAQRAVLWEIVRLSGRIAGFGSLILLGVFGNLAAGSLDYDMGGMWMRVVNGAWVAGVLITAFGAMPAAGRIATLARTAAGGGSAGDYEGRVRRWRIFNAAQSVFYLAMLALMVFRFR